MLNYPVCPRCLGYIPNNVQPGEYIGAISRICDKEICSDCGTEEAVVALIPENQWPIVSYDHKYTQDARDRFYTRMRIEDVDYAQKN
jgi:hypothetical protein